LADFLGYSSDDLSDYIASVYVASDDGTVVALRARMLSAPPDSSALPFDWAVADATQREHATADRDRAGAATLVRALEAAGFASAARVVAGRPAAASAHAADQALAGLLAEHGIMAIPSVSTTAEGTPRFVVTDERAERLAALLETEFGANGVDAELRLFLDEALVEDDCFVDAAPGAGFAALTAATAAGAVAVLTLHDSEREAEALRQSAALSGCATRVQAVEAAQLEHVMFPALGDTGYAVLHAGDARAVADVMTRLRRWQQRDLIGVVAWSRDVTDAAAEQLLSVLGYQHFALADGVDGIELVPAAQRATSGMVFSLSEAYLTRASHANATVDAVVDADVREPIATGDALLQHTSERLFNAVLDDIAPGARAMGGVPSAGMLACAMQDALWPQAKLVSFDIFDTLVVRKSATPQDEFLHLARVEPFAALALLPATLADARQEAEELARRDGYAKAGSTEVTLQAIHAVLAQRIGLSPALVPAMVAAEEQLELALCEAHPVLQAWFERARGDGKTVWCASDTYHTAAFLTRLLEQCGYRMTGVRVFSSADLRANKSSGAMFRLMLAETAHAPHELLHIGDHPSSDGQMAESFGVATIVHPWASARPADDATLAPGDSLALGLAHIGARTREPAAPFWWRFGYSVAGPLLSGFALWLQERFRADGIDRAYFLLRDGEILEAVYRTMCAATGGPSTHLLESSRRAFALPAYDAKRPTLWAQLSATENTRPAREFLERLGVEAGSHAAAFRAAGFAHAEDLVDPRDGRAMRHIASLLQQPAIDRALSARSREERALLIAYLDEQGVLAGGRVALVDVGWNGTIQKSLVAALDLEQRTHALAGYYLGTLPQAHVETGGSQVSGYLCEAGRPSQRCRAVMELPQLLEFVCSTTRGSLRGFVREQGRVVPVHGAVDHDAAQQVSHTQMREGILAFAARFAAEGAAFGALTVSPDVALRRFARLVQRPTAEEAQHVGALRHGEGLAADRSRAFAAFTPANWNIDVVHRDLESAYWPAGLAAQRAPQALLLRAWQWLSQPESE
jgi:predicted HAD superfamily hydrolase